MILFLGHVARVHARPTPCAPFAGMNPGDNDFACKHYLHSGNIAKTATVLPSKRTLVAATENFRGRGLARSTSISLRPKAHFRIAAPENRMGNAGRRDEHGEVRYPRYVTQPVCGKTPKLSQLLTQ